MKKVFPLFLCLTLLLSGCARRPAQKTIAAMDTVMTLTAYGSNAQAGVDAAEAAINRLNTLLSTNADNSEVWAIDHSGGAPVAVSDDTAALLAEALRLGQQTDGALDVSVYPVVRAWGFTTDHYQVPGQAELAALLPLVDYSAIDFDAAAQTVTLPAGMELDFGAIGKGYAGEQAAAAMREAGVTSAAMDLGGNVQTVGSKPDGSPWRVAVKDPRRDAGTEDYVGTVDVSDRAVVTSGGYERYFEADGQTYWHIIDPATGAPARSGLVSVTIVGRSGAECDGLSTALFILGREKALDYWRQYGGFDAILVDEDDQVWVTGGLKDAFSLTKGGAFTLRLVEE